MNTNELDRNCLVVSVFIVSEHIVQRITMCVSSSCSPQTTDHQATSAYISCKLYMARMCHHGAFHHNLFPEYTSVRLVLTGICCQEQVTYFALCSVFRDHVDSV